MNNSTPNEKFTPASRLPALERNDGSLCVGWAGDGLVPSGRRGTAKVILRWIIRINALRGLVVLLLLAGTATGRSENPPALKIDLAQLAPNKLKDIAAHWNQLLRDHPYGENPHLPGFETIDQAAEAFLREEDRENDDIIAGNGGPNDKLRPLGLEAGKVMMTFEAELARWLNANASAIIDDQTVPNWEQQLVAEVFSQGCPEAEAGFRRSLQLRGPGHVTIPQDFAVIKPMVGPVRWFFADELGKLRARGVTFDAAQVAAALRAARLRKVRLELRVARFQAFAEDAVLDALDPDQEVVKMAARYQALFQPLTNESIAASKPGLSLADQFAAARMIEGGAIQLDRALEAGLDTVTRLAPSIFPLLATAQGPAGFVARIASGTTGSERKDYIDYPETGFPRLRARWTPETAPDSPGQVHVSFYVIRQAALTLTVRTDDVSAIKQQGGTATGTPTEEITLGLELSHVTIEPGGRLRLPTGRWSVAVDEQVLGTALRCLGVPTWLANHARLDFDDAGKLTFTLTAAEPDLAVFGLERKDFAPLVCALDLYAQRVSLQQQLLDRLADYKRQCLETLRQRVMTALQSREIEGIRFVADAPVAPEAPASPGALDVWKRTVTAQRAARTLFRFEVQLDNEAPVPRVSIAHFALTEDFQVYFRETLIGKVRGMFPWADDVREFANITIGEPESSAAGPGICGTFALSFATLNIKDLPEPPVLAFSYFPLAPGGQQWKPPTADWSQWYKDCRAKLSVALSASLGQLSGDAVHHLVGHTLELPGIGKVRVIDPVEYRATERAVVITTEWELADAADTHFQVAGVLVRGGFNAATGQWEKPDLDFSQAHVVDAARLEAALRTMLHLPDLSKLGSDRFHMVTPRFDHGGFALHLHIAIPEIDVDIDTPEIVISARGVSGNLHDTVRTIFNQTVKTVLAKADFEVKGIGPVESIAYDEKDSQFDGDLKLATLVTLKLLGQTVTAPVIVYPNFDVDGFKAAVQGAAEKIADSYLQHALKINLPGHVKINPKQPCFLLNPARMQIIVEFDLPGIAHITIDPVIITQTGVELPERLEIGVEALTKELTKGIQGATSGMIAISKPSLVFFPKDAGRLELDADITYADEQTAALLVAHAKIKTDLGNLAALKVGIEGKLEIVENEMFKFDGEFDLGKHLLSIHASPEGLLALLATPTVEAKLDFGPARRLDARASIKALGMHIANAQITISLPIPDVRFDASLSADLLIGEVLGSMGAGIERGRMFLDAHGGVKITCGVPIADVEAWINLRRARVRFSALGLHLGLAAPGVAGITPSALWDILAALMNFNPECLAEFLKHPNNIQIGLGHGAGDDGEGGRHDPDPSDDSTNPPGPKGTPGPSPALVGPNPAPVGPPDQPTPPPAPTVTPTNFGPSEKGDPIYGSKGCDRPEIRAARWLVKEIDQAGDRRYNWASGRVLRVALVPAEHRAYLCPFYFDAKVAEADTAPPVPLLNDYERFTGNPDATPNDLCRDLFDLLINGGPTFSGTAEAIARSQDAAAVPPGSVKKVEVKVFRITYPQSGSGEEFDGGIKTADPHEFAYHGVVIVVEGQPSYLLRFRDQARFQTKVTLSFAADDPLVTENCLPLADQPGDESARFLGQIAALPSPERQRTLLARGPVAWLLSDDWETVPGDGNSEWAHETSRLTRITRDLGSHAAVVKIHRPSGSADASATTRAAWLPVAQVADRLGLADHDTIYVKDGQPTEMLVLSQPGGGDWSLRNFAPAPAGSEPADFLDAGGAKLKDSLQILGRGLLAWARTTPTIGSGATHLIIGCGTGASYPNTSLGESTPDANTAEGNCGKEHWGVRFHRLGPDANPSLTVHDCSALDDATEVQIKAVLRGQTVAVSDERQLHAVIEHELQFIAEKNTSDDATVQQWVTQLKLDPGHAGNPSLGEWVESRHLTGQEVTARWRDWIDHRNAVKSAALLQPDRDSSQTLLTGLLYARASEWHRFLNGSPRGIIYGN